LYNVGIAAACGGSFSTPFWVQGRSMGDATLDPRSWRLSDRSLFEQGRSTVVRRIVDIYRRHLDLAADEGTPAGELLTPNQYVGFVIAV
jgi:hypothetical protein